MTWTTQCERANIFVAWGGNQGTDLANITRGKRFRDD